jgi:hypothetical protein
MLQVTVFSLPATHTGRWPYPTLKQEGHFFCCSSAFPEFEEECKKKISGLREYTNCLNSVTKGTFMAANSNAFQWIQKITAAPMACLNDLSKKYNFFGQIVVQLFNIS